MVVTLVSTWNAVVRLSSQCDEDAVDARTTDIQGVPKNGYPVLFLG